MGKFDGILNAFRMNNDDDEEYEEYDGYDEGDYEPAPKSSKSRKTEVNDSSDDYEPEPKKSGRGILAPKTAPKNFNKKGNRDMSNMEVCVFKPAEFADSTAIVDSLLGNRSVVMNLEGLEMDLAQRIFDFVTGACYALNGRMEPISKYVYVITPSNVNISGDTATDESVLSLGKGFPV